MSNQALLPKRRQSNYGQKWNAGRYHLHSSIQFEASKKILGEISFDGDEHILDIGCGDGKITAMISSYIPNGKILGIDLSPEMILFAKSNYQNQNYKNISFSLKNAVELDFTNKFDLIFSSFALHWVMDFNSFMKKINTALKNTGRIVFTIPLGISSPLEQATEELIQNFEWSKFFAAYKSPWRFSNASEYKAMILDAGFELTSFEVVLHAKTFDSRSSFESYVIQWYPYINYIDDDLKEIFFTKLVDRYLEINPAFPSGEVYFEFPRIDIVANKK